jgi:hypothetical protein
MHCMLLNCCWLADAAAALHHKRKHPQQARALTCTISHRIGARARTFRDPHTLHACNARAQLTEQELKVPAIASTAQHTRAECIVVCGVEHRSNRKLFSEDHVCRAKIDGGAGCVHRLARPANGARPVEDKRAAALRFSRCCACKWQVRAQRDADRSAHKFLRLCGCKWADPCAARRRTRPFLCPRKKCLRCGGQPLHVAERGARARCWLSRGFQAAHTRATPRTPDVRRARAHACATTGPCAKRVGARSPNVGVRVTMHVDCVRGHARFCCASSI